jgi:hypothetical protein
MERQNSHQTQTEPVQDFEDVEMTEEPDSQPTPSLDRQESSNSYRLVNKEYYCYSCCKRQKKMMAVKDLFLQGLTCDTCG